MLQQVAILPAGCQVYRKASVLYYSASRILYASSLAVYVLDPQTFRVIKVLSMNQRAITSITVSEINPDYMVVTGRDGLVTLWHIEEEEMLSQIVLAGSVIAAWNPLVGTQVAILSEEMPRLHLWLVYCCASVF
ncbi:hypothetical protein EON64_16830 [archaeon]|nr:MAG: hypothetical protein EON64_16830 [archaeon]